MASERPKVERRSGEDRRRGVERRSPKGAAVRTPGRNDRRTGGERRAHERRLKGAKAGAPNPGKKS